MVTFLKGELPPGGPPPNGTMLTLPELAALAKAPRRPSTRVTVRAFDVPSSKWEQATGRPFAPWAKAISPDHMFVEYDDGRETYIYRGGPSGAQLRARVDPASRSPDYQRGERVLYETDMPGQTARDAIVPAQEMADRIDSAKLPYLLFRSNSNTAVADLTEEQLGVRVRDLTTPGAQRYPPGAFKPMW